ncbi:MAG: urease accessory protein UreD [Deltaproteobacteria bacterium]|nr:urease accessory protein UreD [Deltaproteobacteria bacterium]
MNPMTQETPPRTSLIPLGSKGRHESGVAEMVFKPSPKGRTYLSHQYLTYPFHTTRVFRLDPHWPDLATLYLTSASGGLFQRDRISIEAQIKEGASAHVTTGSATKVHSMEKDLAVHTVNIQIEQNGYLEYLTEPTILFPRSRLASRVKVRVEKGGCAILGDSFLTHDPSGVSPAPFDALLVEVSVHGAKDALLALDRTRLNGKTPFLSIPGLTGDCFAQGSIYFIWDGEPPDEMAMIMMNEIEASEGIYAGASTLPGNCGAYARILADDPLALDRALWGLTAACRRLATGHTMPPRRK